MILVAEDFLGGFFAQVLSEAGHTVCLVLDREETLLHLKARGPYSGVLMDLWVPGVTSPIFWMREVRGLHPGPLVVCSGMVNREYEKEAAALGAVWLPKPFGPAQLVGSFPPPREP